MSSNYPENGFPGYDAGENPQYFNPQRDSSEDREYRDREAGSSSGSSADSASEGGYGSYSSTDDDPYSTSSSGSRRDASDGASSDPYRGPQYGSTAPSGSADAGRDGSRGKKPGRGNGGKFARRAAVLVLSGAVFGAAAGGTMYGVYRAANAASPARQETIAQQETTATSADASASSGSGSSDSAKPMDVTDIVANAMPSVVAINNKMIVTQNDFFFGQQQYEASGSGSGIIAGQNDSELLIVTNNHVVKDSEEMSVTFTDGDSVKASIKGTDSDSDLAVVSVALSDIPDETKGKIKIANLGDSDSLKLGQGVVAIGNALGKGQSVTTGVVSALNKQVTIDGVTRNLIQVDAAINPGNSGGALLDLDGNVIGINSAKYSDTDVEGIGYAIPISQAKSIIDELMSRQTRKAVPENEQGYLGIRLQNIDSSLAQAYGMPEGIYVYQIIKGGAAEKSDLHERDIITKIDGQSVKTGEELKDQLKYYRGGETVTLTVQTLENGQYQEREVQVTLGYRKDAQNLPGNSGSDDDSDEETPPAESSAEESSADEGTGVAEEETP